MPEKQLSNRIYNLIAASRVAVFEKTIHQAFEREFSATEIENALQSLIDQGKIQTALETADESALDESASLQQGTYYVAV